MRAPSRASLEHFETHSLILSKGGFSQSKPGILCHCCTRLFSFGVKNFLAFAVAGKHAKSKSIFPNRLFTACIKLGGVSYVWSDLPRAKRPPLLLNGGGGMP